MGDQRGESDKHGQEGEADNAGERRAAEEERRNTGDESKASGERKSPAEREERSAAEGGGRSKRGERSVANHRGERDEHSKERRGSTTGEITGGGRAANNDKNGGERGGDGLEDTSKQKTVNSVNKKRDDVNYKNVNNTKNKGKPTIVKSVHKNNVNKKPPPTSHVKKSLKCIYTNMDSLLNKRPEFFVTVQEEDPDVICLTEVLPKNLRYALNQTELNNKGYDCFSKTDEKNSHRGVLIYVKTNIKAQEVNVVGQDVVKDTIWVEIHLTNGDTALIGCVYRSPNNSQEENTNLYNLIEVAIKGRSHVLLVGDFNHPEIDWENETTPNNSDHKASIFMEKVVRDNFLFQHVKRPTHYRGEQNPTLIDLILTNEEGMINKINHRAPIGRSHHQVLSFDYIAYSQDRSSEQERYIYSKGDYNKIREEVKQQNLAQKIAPLDAKSAWDCLTDTCSMASKNNIPKTTPGRQKQPKSPPPLWMNEKALKKVRKKHASFERYMETKEGKDYRTYAKARNQAGDACKKALKEYERSIAKNAKVNPKAFYAYVNSKLKTKIGIPDLKDNKGNKATTEKEKADTLNDFFCSVFTEENTEEIPTCEMKDIKHELGDIQITQEKVLKKLKQLDTTKSPGPDGFHARFLNELAEELSEPLALIFSKSLEEGSLPTTWKDANVTPIYKKGEKSDPGNYRPISLTSLVCKIMESIIRDEVMTHLKENDLLTCNQHGFVPKRSCVTNLLDMMDKWTNALDVQTPVDTVYLDFAKAFDSVPHQRLLAKVKSYGITGHVGSWISDFLTNRRQRVSVQGSFSGWSKVLSGVPQGSVLGPILFVIYINDLPEGIKSWCSLYADDTKVSTTVDTEEGRRKLQEDLDRAVQWADTWQLKFHTGKCKVIHFGNKNVQHNYTMKTHNSEERVTLATTSSEKDLGVEVDNELKFSQHIEKQVGKANRILGQIRRSFQYLDANTMKLLFTSLVRPHLEYANAIWSPRLKKDNNLIEGVLRRATKLIPGMKDLDYSERLKKINIPSMKYRRERGDMIEVYKFVHGEYDMPPPFTLENDKRTRGHTFKIKKIRVNTSLRQGFFSERVVDKWNNLPDELVTATSINIFKNGLDSEWKAAQFAA